MYTAQLHVTVMINYIHNATTAQVEFPTRLVLQLPHQLRALPHQLSTCAHNLDDFLGFGFKVAIFQAIHTKLPNFNAS